MHITHKTHDEVLDLPHFVPFCSLIPNVACKGSQKLINLYPYGYIRTCEHRTTLTQTPTQAYTCNWLHGVSVAFTVQDRKLWWVAMAQRKTIRIIN